MIDNKRGCNIIVFPFIHTESLVCAEIFLDKSTIDQLSQTTSLFNPPMCNTPKLSCIYVPITIIMNVLEVVNGWLNRSMVFDKIYFYIKDVLVKVESIHKDVKNFILGLRGRSLMI